MWSRTSATSRCSLKSSQRVTPSYKLPSRCCIATCPAEWCASSGGSPFMPPSPCETSPDKPEGFSGQGGWLRALPTDVATTIPDRAYRWGLQQRLGQDAPFHWAPLRQTSASRSGTQMWPCTQHDVPGTRNRPMEDVGARPAHRADIHNQQAREIWLDVRITTPARPRRRNARNIGSQGPTQSRSPYSTCSMDCTYEGSQDDQLCQTWLWEV